MILINRVLEREPYGGLLDISARNPLDVDVNDNTPPPVPSQPAHSGLATASMICGFLVLPSCFATFLPAVILGHIAMSRARSESGSTGRAKLGLIFGYGSLALIPVIAAIAGLAAPLVIRQ